MKFLSLSRRRFSSLNVPTLSGEERGETAVFAGYGRVFFRIFTFYIISREQKRDEHGASMASIIVEINRMIITPDQIALVINILWWLIRTKHFPDSKNTSQNPKHIPKSGFWEVFWILGSIFGFWEVFLDSGTCFVLWDMFLESGKRFVLTSHRSILLFSDHESIYSFSSNQHFQAIEFVDRPVQKKLHICCINLS